MSGTTSNQRLKDWVAEWAAITNPADIYWCDGSADEYERLLEEHARFQAPVDGRRPRHDPEVQLAPDEAVENAARVVVAHRDLGAGKLLAEPPKNAG